MEANIFWIEKAFLILGILLILRSIFGYGRRSKDWKGALTLFVKRIPMTITEHKWYRLGVMLVCVAVALKVIFVLFGLDNPYGAN